MPRPTLWTAIADTLRDEIASGHYAPGARLPSEAQLARRFGVNRHTLRRAMAQLAEEGLLRTRRGAGAFVAQRVTDYPIGRRVRFHANLLAAGRTPDRRLRSLETRSSDAEEARALGIVAGAQVHVYEGQSLADGQPVSTFRSVFPADRFPGLPEGLARHASVTRALALCGVGDFTRHSTRVTAVLADAAQAAQLDLVVGAPLLRTISVNVDPEGRPVEYGRTHFAGDRVTLTLAADPTGQDSDPVRDAGSAHSG
jgi:GntR family phosphonate transport system transcriptional regulator